MYLGELAGKDSMKIRGKEHVVDQIECRNSHRDHRAPVDAGQENVLWRVDLNYSDEGYREAGDDYTGGSVAIQKRPNVNAKPKPARVGYHKEIAGLGEQSCNDDRGDHPDNGEQEPI